MMNKVENETLKKAFKPYDIVSDKLGNVGFIQEVGVNECQQGFDAQISYAIKWLTGTNEIHAWFDHCELKRHCNLFVVIAESSCHPLGNNYRHVSDLFSNW